METSEATGSQQNAGASEPNNNEPATMAEAVEAESVASGDLPIGIRAFIDAGVHFGHQTRRWNPKMRQYIFGARNGIHILDLDQTAVLFKRAFEFVSERVARGGHVLFVGTKRQAADVIAEEAKRAQQFYVTGRWLGGTLTNFRTVKGSIERLRELERQDEEGELDLLLKKEAVMIRRDTEKLQKYLGGIKMMDSLPAVMFVVDPSNEHIAIREARKLHIPIVALTDTNCDPELIDFVIPGNDDAIRSIRLITSRIADACVEGMSKRRTTGNENFHAGGAPGAGPAVEFARARRKPPANAIPPAVDPGDPQPPAAPVEEGKK